MSISKVEFTYKKPHLRYDGDIRKWIGYKVDVRAGKKRFRNTFKTKAEAERFVTELRNKTLYRTAGLKFAVQLDVPLADLFAKVLKQIKSPKLAILDKRVFGLFESVFDAPPKVTEVRKVHIQKFINLRLETVKPETVDREITAISSALKRAAELFPEQLEDYETPQIPRPKTSKRKRKRHLLTETEKDAVVHSILTQRGSYHEYRRRAESRPTIARMFEAAWLIGLRLSELLDLRKTDPDRAAKTLKVRRNKTDDIHVLEHLPDRLFDILDAAAEHSTTDRVFELRCSDMTFGRTIAAACRANGIPYGRNNPEGFTFHATRHAFTSRLSKVTDIATAREYTGHSSGVMVEYYSHADDGSKRKAMEDMYGNGREKTLAEIWQKVRSGKMTKKAFLDALKTA